MASGGAARTWDKPNPALEGASSLRDRFDVVHSLRKPPEEGRRIQLLEGRFGALERQLGQPLAAKTALADDGEQVTVLRTIDFKARPGASID